MYVCPNCSNRCFLVECACGCGKIITAKNDHYYVRRYVNGHNPVAWKGGLTKNNDGYILVRQPNHPFATKTHPYIMMHRLIYEEANRCILLPWANVHHINGIRTDNHPSNLKAMTRGQHTSLELVLRHSKRNVHQM